METDHRYWIGFDLGGTKMQVVICDWQMRILHRKRKKTKGIDGPKAGLDRIAEMIEKIVEEVGGTPDQIAGIGIGCPGPIEWSKGIVRMAVNLSWKNTPVGDFLQEKFGRPVSVLNDVDAGVYGEYKCGAAKDSRCVLGIFPGTGIGGGCVYEGNILRGRNLTAMEIGHIRIGSGTRTTGIRMQGTLESEASRLSIAAECAKLAYRGEAPYLMKAAGTDLSKLRSKLIAEAIEHGDVAVERVVERACEHIGIAVVNVIHLLCPDTIVLGGGVVEAMRERMVNEVNKTVKKYLLDCYQDEYRIVAAKLGDDAGSLGAAAYVAAQNPQVVVREIPKAPLSIPITEGTGDLTDND
jgi:glucokinase